LCWKGGGVGSLLYITCEKGKDWIEKKGDLFSLLGRTYVKGVDSLNN